MFTLSHVIKICRERETEKERASGRAGIEY